MPNVKIHVDREILNRQAERLDSALLPLRELLCDRFGVQPAACQLAIIAVRGLNDQPNINVEIHILPRPERTSEHVTAVCGEVKSLIELASDTRTAVRCMQLDAQTYVALK